MNTKEKVIVFKPKKPLKAPTHLKKAGRTLWQSVAESFVLEEHDLAILTALAETLDKKNQAEAELKAAGALTFKNKYGEIRSHPCVSIIRDCCTTMARLRRELNLSELPEEGSRPPALKFGGKK